MQALQKQRGKDETAGDDSKEQDEVESENENTDTNQRVQSRGYETLNQSLDAKGMSKLGYHVFLV